MKKLALLVIDVQNALMDEKPFDAEILIQNIKRLLNKCRESAIEVIYIQHCDEAGGELEPNTYGWEIFSDINPSGNEQIFQKYYNSAFKETGLKTYLDSKGITDLVITGMQTDYCVDTSVKVAFEYGFKLIIPKKSNTTFDNGLFSADKIYEHYNDKIFHGRFGDVISVDDTIALIDTLK